MITLLILSLLSSTVADIRPYKINVPQDVLDDLSYRLNHTRYPDQLAGSEWEYGMNHDVLREMVDYWQHGYDWRAQEAKLNEFPQFITQIDDVDIHFIHVKSSSPKTAYPLLMIHGWPGSFMECTKVIQLYREEKDGVSFDVVCPSLPGYGFSGHPKQKKFDTIKIAETFSKLMSKLGYKEYVAQGGDWGGIVSVNVANVDKQHCKGIHLNFFPYGAQNKGIFATMRWAISLSSRWIGGEDYDHSWRGLKFLLQETGYAHIQATKPDTVSVGLNDSPVGLASYILEKFHSWSDLRGKTLQEIYTKDELLNNVMIYWVGKSIGSSMRLYFEEVQHSGERSIKDLYINQPSGYIQFPGEVSQPPKWTIEHYLNLVHYSKHHEGGHFAALELPEVLVADVRKFFHVAGIGRNKQETKEEL